MHTRVFALAGACVFLFLNLPARGQKSPNLSPGSRQEAVDDKDPAAILEIGAATSWNVTGGAATFAPNFAVETTPIENAELRVCSAAAGYSVILRANVCRKSSALAGD